MKKLKMGVGVLAIVLLNLLLFGSNVQALTILSGYDLFETPDGPDTYMDFATNPIPADFFGPGSDPFTGTVILRGEPLNTNPPDILGPSDTIIKRINDAILPACPSSTTVDIEIVALSLTSVSPITVTYNGGQNPELWDVDVCLSDMPQSPGSMNVNQNCPEGGTFSANLPVLPKFTFTHLTLILVLDFGPEGIPPIAFTTANGSWLHSDPGFGIITSPGGLTVDHNCDGNPSVPVGASSNFFASMQANPCDCVNPVQDFAISTTIFQNPIASHAVNPPIVPVLTISPGYDLFETPDTPDTYMDFSTYPIPADFFGPGSDPFTGTVLLRGVPLNTNPPNILDPSDTIIKRLEDAILLTCPSSTTVDIEIVALSLTSVTPITVTWNGGQNPENWDVDVCLSGYSAQTPGSMTINLDCPEGGTFNSTLPVLPRFTFTHLTNILALDFGLEGIPPIDLTTTNGHWLHSDPGFGVITSPGGLDVDHDCDGVIDMPVGASSNFFASLQANPCDCVNPVQDFAIDTTIFQNPIAGHAVIPPLPSIDVIPTLNEWGMIILALLLVTFGTVAIIRRRKAVEVKG